MGIFKAEMQAEKGRLEGELAVAGDRAEQSRKLAAEADGRGLHSFAFQLNVSAFCGTRGV